ncbi:MAG TPA: carbamoyltransferase C-terminal domain-containing protein, partial [Roseiflexaceae bacterium]|nr:carbamoyltransferase C-terminal domain-containing protein [Roseiflexaceae bacterium]
VAAAEEERFQRVKYWAGFPVQAIRYCLETAGIGAADLDHIGISRDPSANLYKKALYVLRRRPNFDFIKDRLNNMARVRDLRTAFCERMAVTPQELKASFHNVEHHRAHMASAFFVSPFEDAAVLSVDGMGDFVSTMWGTGNGNQLEVTGKVNYPHSLGWLYTAASQWLGFPKYGDEGKVMGLAPLGRPIYMDRFAKVLRIQRDGSFDLDMDYFALDADGANMSWDDGEPTVGTIFSRKFVNLFGPPRQPRSELTELHQDVAASLQAALEEAEMSLVRMLQRTTGKKALCMAGGVALNSAFNGKILPNTGFEDIFIQPAAGDAGTALGVAFYIHHQLLGQPRSFVMRDAATGPCFANSCIAEELEGYGLFFDEYPDDELCSETAGLIADGKVVGWFQGRMEWGPRALGNRSILADPRRDDMKDILNARIKYREKFRPFAPAVLLEHTGEYFDQDYPDPFMLKVYNVRPEMRERIPAVTHVDGTGRLQTVEQSTAPLYWRTIKEFENRTGVPVILNTSFNENEPIVCRPKEAIECYLRTKMDALVIGNYVVRKD